MIKKDKKTVSALDEQITVKLPLDLKTPKEYLSDEDYQLVTEIFTTIAKYRVPNWYSEISVSEMQSDAIYLQSMQVFIAQRFAVLIAYSQNIEEQLKIARSKVRILSKNLKEQYEKEGDAVSVTIDDIKDLSYTKTEEIWAKLEDSRIAAEFVKFVYYSSRDHIAMLEKVITRVHRLE